MSPHASLYRRIRSELATNDPDAYAPPLVVCLFAWLWVMVPWRKVYDYTFLFIVAYLIAVGLVATFWPLYDLTH